MKEYRTKEKKKKMKKDKYELITVDYMAWWTMTFVQ